MKDFSPDTCDCLSPCTTRKPEAGLIEYGQYKLVAELASRIAIDTKQISAAVIYLLDDRETTNEEISDYAWEQFLSDVGGSAGLVLGLSFATIFGIFDFLIAVLCIYVKKLVNRFINIARNKTTDGV